MTLKESLGLYCEQQEQCIYCPIGSVCEKFHDENDPYETITDMSDDCVKVIAHDARHIAEKILFHLKMADNNEEPCPF